MPRRDHLPDLAALTVLTEVARRGGIGTAARSVGISQQSTSPRLRALERHIGVRLVVLTTGLALTRMMRAVWVGDAVVPVGPVRDLVTVAVRPVRPIQRTGSRS